MKLRTAHILVLATLVLAAPAGAGTFDEFVLTDQTQLLALPGADRPPRRGARTNQPSAKLTASVPLKKTTKPALPERGFFYPASSLHIASADTCANILVL